MLKLNSFFGVIILLAFSPIFAQVPTVGLRYTDYSASEGYTLFTPQLSNKVFLIDNCGEKVHEWTFSEYPALTCYLLPNGNLLRAGIDSLEIRDWDNNQLWVYATTANGINQHHDIEPLPNGNILCIAADIKSAVYAANMGRDPLLGPDQFKLERIVELQPLGPNQANIVWEWSFEDHMIQDYDPSKLYYGVVEENPQLLDVNFDNGEPVDYIHLNSIDYNEQLDQIMISARHLSEIYIIDHSTTTSEAAGHTGGNSGKGGDILYRWGNPNVYRQYSTPQKLFNQHDAQWVPIGFPDQGKISCFNNGGDGSFSYSSIHLFEPSIDGYNYLTSNSTFLPTDYSWSWHGEVLGDTIYDDKKSSAMQLENGNMLLCSSIDGEFVEVNQSGDVVWVYRNPVGSTGIYNQGENTFGTDIMLFRATRYVPDYAGFAGQSLQPMGILEDVNNVSAACREAGIDESLLSRIWVENPVLNGEFVVNNVPPSTSISIYNLQGEILYCTEDYKNESIQIENFEGVCLMHLFSANSIRTVKLYFN